MTKSCYSRNGEIYTFFCVPSAVGPTRSTVILLRLGDMYVLLGRYIDVPETATRAGPHNNGDADRVCDPPHGSEVGEDVPERTTRMHTLCRETMALNTDWAGIFGDSFVDVNV